MIPICRAVVVRSFPRTSRFCSTSQFPNGFSFWPNYFSIAEQRALLSAALEKLDCLEMRQTRLMRKKYWSSKPDIGRGLEDSPSMLFAPDEMYEFEEGHFDGVIHHYRETHLSSWPTDKVEGLKSALGRLYSLCPTQETLTHILHLSSHGEILPHTDNTEASGRWILGVSLGDERILYMKENLPEGRTFSLALPSGSVYLQRDDIRYNFLHGISRSRGKDRILGQRLSIMIRDARIDDL